MTALMTARTGQQPDRTAPAPKSGKAGAEAAVTLQAVSKSFGRHRALHELTCQLPKGVITGIVGPDAAGKTTMLRLLAGLLQPDAGSIRILGRTPLELVAAEPNRLGYMPQKFGLYEDLTVLANLRLHARLRGLERERGEALFARLLAFTGLGPFTDRLAGRLSGGMKQKLGIACALLGDPDLLLLDEPGVGVDPLSRRELWTMVAELAGQGMTILWSTAYLDEAERCPHILMLDEGRILYQGEPAAFSARCAGRVWLLSRQGEHTAAKGSSKAVPEDGAGNGTGDDGGHGAGDGAGNGTEDGARGTVLTDDSRAGFLHYFREPGVEDVVVQGSSLRLVLAEDAPQALSALMQQTGHMVSPRLEDAYMSALGGINAAPSPYTSGIRRVPGQEPAIVASHLTRTYGSFTAAGDISFTVQQGQIFGLLGPNGAGKSTTFRMLCGLTRPTSGTCSVAGINMLSSTSQARARLGYMAQKFSLYPDIPVRANIRIYGTIYGLGRDELARRGAELAAALGLEEHLGDITGSLSLGLKQRLALLCATLHDPAVLFLDEPTSGVDVRTRRDFWKHILAMTGRGTSVLVTTHLMDEAEYCDAIALIYQGRMIRQGNPDELKAACRTRTGLTDPTLEEAFIAQIERYDEDRGEDRDEGHGRGNGGEHGSNAPHTSARQAGTLARQHGEDA